MRRLLSALALAAALSGTTAADTGSLNAIIGERPATREADPEAFPVTDEPVSAIRIITGRPLPGETCREALFEARPLVMSRAEATADEVIPLSLDNLCLIEFRNDARDRSLEIRVGEDLSALAITADQRLFRGLVLVPNQTTSVPIRPLPVGSLPVRVDVVWAEPAAGRTVQTFTLALSGP